MADLRIGVIGLAGKWSTEALADALEARCGYRRVIDMTDVHLDLASGCCFIKAWTSASWMAWP